MKVERAQSKDRILALEVRPRVTGFAVLEGPRHLLDWGMRKHPPRKLEPAGIVARKINALLDFYFPSVVIVRARNVWSPKARRRITAIIRVARREANRRSINFRIVSTKAVHQFFAPHKCATKHQIATLIAGWFPELSWRLPPKRKSWKSEDHRMVVFDAAATALSFLGRSSPVEK
jgi:hypothetical protein